MLVDVSDVSSPALDGDAVRDWLNEQPDDSFFCPSCLTRLVQRDGSIFYCPNEMCLDEREWSEEID